MGRWQEMIPQAISPSGQRGSRVGTPLMVAIVVWICVMALVGAVTAPLFGWRAVLVIGPVLLALILAACWLLCVPYERARTQWDSAAREAARRRSGQ